MPRVELNRVVWFSQGVLLSLCAKDFQWEIKQEFGVNMNYIFLCGEANESKYHTRRPPHTT